MLAFLTRRVLTLAATMLGASLLVFLLLQVDGDSVAVHVLGPYAAPDQLRHWLQENGYDRPVLQRYAEWLRAIAHGDLGMSIRFRVPVAGIVGARLWNTTVLGAWAMAIYVSFGLLLGVLAGMREGSPADRIISIASVVASSIPEFASAALLSFIFVYRFKLLPGTSGMNGGWDAAQLVLPVMVLVLYGFGYITRMTRASMAEVMGTPFIRTAMLKGLPRRRVIVSHALRNALIAPFTVIVLQVNWLLAGVIVAESFFAYRGFGALLLDAALSHDVFLLQGCTLVAVCVAVLTQFAADIGYMYLNPRIRFD